MMRLGERLPRWLLALLVSLSPLLVTVALLRLQLNVSVADYLPVGWNDATWYWHQTASFSQVGFNSGYYTVNEQPPRLAGYKFSSAGPLFPVVYGFFAHFTGWDYATGILYNMVVLVGASLLFIRLAQLSKSEILLFGGLLLLIGPVLLYLPTNAQETLHQAGALVLAGMLVRSWRGSTSWGFRLLTLVWLLFISQLRLSWGLLLLPVCLSFLSRFSWRGLAGALLLTGFGAIITYMGVNITSTPEHSTMFIVADQLSQQPGLALQALLLTVERNINASFLRLHNILDLGLKDISGLQIALVVGFGLMLTFQQTSRWKARAEGLFHLYNLLMIVGVGLVLYAYPGYYRVFGAHVLLSALVLLACHRLRAVLLLLLVSALLLGVYLRLYPLSQAGNYALNPATVAEAQQELARHVVYQPGASPWCNTLLLSGFILDERLLYVPPGIGISMIIQRLPEPMKSRYLLVTDRYLEVTRSGLGDSWEGLEWVAETRAGTLYRNTRADCP